MVIEAPGVTEIVLLVAYAPAPPPAKRALGALPPPPPPIASTFESEVTPPGTVQEVTVPVQNTMVLPPDVVGEH